MGGQNFCEVNEVFFYLGETIQFDLNSQIFARHTERHFRRYEVKWSGQDDDSLLGIDSNGRPKVVTYLEAGT